MDPFNLWAKTGTEGRWHALPCHLLDVAAAADTLWERLPAASRAIPARSFGDEAVARVATVFLAASHDIGKANRFFQAKAIPQKARLRSIGLALPQDATEPAHGRHGQATGAYLESWLRERLAWDRLPAMCVALAVGGHHGQFNTDTRHSTTRVDEDPWRTLGPALLDELWALLGDDEPPPAPTPLNAFLGWLSGFVCVADWLGSNEQMVTWKQEPVDLAAYWRDARTRAEGLLDGMEWHAPPATAAAVVDDLVPTGRTPNELQRVAEEIAADFSLAILEAPTGEGKTEAAFALLEPDRAAGRGAYFALPTRATANGLHGRVERFLAREGIGELKARLLHSSAWLHEQAVENAADPGDEDGIQRAEAEDWFAGSKRGLLAPYGVGTIDQALIAALRARHGFVRLFALAGKVVVVDEVHAYDVYMGDLLDVLLGWLRALGCKVVLLSATLPSVRRRQLLAAWGCAEPDLPEAVYPAATWVDGSGGVRTRSFQVAPRKPLRIEPVPPAGAEPWRVGAERILARVREHGGAGALVLNTVRDSQAACEHLRGIEKEIPITLFHGRFTMHDRERIEKSVLERFGKDRPSGPAILVATQVVEQSLDLDFDEMVSALAPVDLLVQRAGRLHRHRRTGDGALRGDDGPDERPDPTLEVLLPELGDDGLPATRQPVYSQYVLARTLLWLDRGRSIAEAADVAGAVEAVYREEEHPEGRLAEWAVDHFWNLEMESLQADQSRVPDVEDDDRLLVETDIQLDERDERHDSRMAARTRLQKAPSYSIILLRKEPTGVVPYHGGDTARRVDMERSGLRSSLPKSVAEALAQGSKSRTRHPKGLRPWDRCLFVDKDLVEIGGYLFMYDPAQGLSWRKSDVVVSD